MHDFYAFSNLTVKHDGCSAQILHDQDLLSSTTGWRNGQEGARMLLKGVTNHEAEAQGRETPDEKIHEFEVCSNHLIGEDLECHSNLESLAPKSIGRPKR